MDALTGYISTHPAIFAMGAALIIVVFFHFTFKSLAKLLFIVLIILMAIYGYYSFKDKEKFADETQQSGEWMQSMMDDVKAKSKTISSDFKDLYRKSKAAPKEVDKMLDTSDKELNKELKK
jgi:hypothetical protein